MGGDVGYGAGMKGKVLIIKQRDQAMHRARRLHTIMYCFETVTLSYPARGVKTPAITVDNGCDLYICNRILA
jgi:hypothetical protein